MATTKRDSRLAKWARFKRRVRVRRSWLSGDGNIVDVRNVELADGRAGYWCPCHGFEPYRKA